MEPAMSIEKFEKKLNGITSRSNAMSIDEKITKLNQVIRGWINYFNKYNPSAIKYTIECIQRRIVIWAMCKYKHLRGRRQRAEKWLLEVKTREPKLFAHWSYR